MSSKTNNYIKSTITQKILELLQNQQEPQNITNISRKTLIGYVTCVDFCKILKEDKLITMNKVGRTYEMTLTKKGEKALGLLQELDKLTGEEA